MRDDVIWSYPDIDPDKVKVVHNGIDTDDWARVDKPDRVRELGVDPDRPSVIFVGRITRQKGLPLFLRAAAQLPPDVQLVLCAGAPDTPEIEAEVLGLVEELQQGPHRRRLDPRDAAAARRRRPAVQRDRVRLPVDLRAARHRQPRGDGLRDGRRRHRDRRHPRGRRRRRDRPTRPDRAGHRRHRHPAEPRPVRRRLRRRAQRGRRRPRPRPARWAGPAASAPSTRSAGAPSPSRRWRSTARPLPAGRGRRASACHGPGDLRAGSSRLDQRDVTASTSAARCRRGRRSGSPTRPRRWSRRPSRAGCPR